MNLPTDIQRSNGAVQEMPKKKATRIKSEAKKLRMTIYLPEAQLWDMRAKAVALRIKSDTAAVEEAVAYWLEDSVARPDAKTRALIDTVLSDPEERAGLEKYLSWAVDSVRKRKKAGG